MRAKLVGLVEKQGVFEGKPYHSIKLHCIAPSDDKDFTGWRVLDPKTTSIKYDRLPYIVGRLMELSELVTYVGSEIDIQYNDNKQITGISFEFDKGWRTPDEVRNEASKDQTPKDEAKKDK